MFEIVSPPTIDPTSEAKSVTMHLAHSNIEGANQRIIADGPCKIVLPAGSENPASDRSRIITRLLRGVSHRRAAKWSSAS
jgi:hypothetical protein